MYQYADDDVFTPQACEPAAVRNDEMNLAWQFLTGTSMSVFLTGKAGTGKTTFLKRLRELSPKRMVVLAPTGVAAINAGGQTIHSFLQLPFGPFIPGTKRNDAGSPYRMAESKKNLIRTVDLLVIDEVSMVRADLLDQIDDALRNYRDRTLPFGGVQLLLIGDLMQLSPVAKTEEWAMLRQHYDTPYFFSSHALRQLSYATIELKHIYRQQDQKFIDLLGRVRNNTIDQACLDMLNARYQPGFEPDEGNWIRLTTHTLQADNYNALRLSSLNGKRRAYTAKVKNDFPETSYPADFTVELCTGAQVMFVKNDPSGEHAYYNGKIGVVTDMGEDCVVVKCPEDDEPIKVIPVTWDNCKYVLDHDTMEVKESVVGTFTQYPLRLAWAITVHKSQGLTFDHAVLDINASFTHGQAYVALSRCRSLEGLMLASPVDPRAFITDPTVDAYVASATEAAREAASQLPTLRRNYALQLLGELYSFRALQNDVNWMLRVVDEHLSGKQPVLRQALAQAAQSIETDLVQVGSRFIAVCQASLPLEATRIAGTPLARRIIDSANYFLKELGDIFKPVSENAVIAINNKSVSQVYNNALSMLKADLAEKLIVFAGLMEKEFTITDYLSLRAKGRLAPHGGSSAGKARKQAPKAADKATKPAEKAPKPKKVPTVDVTLELARSGMTPAQIAAERKLAESTIYTHLSVLVERGDLDAAGLVPAERLQAIQQAVGEFKEAYTLTEVMQKLPEGYSFGEIRLAIAHLNAHKPQG